MRGRQRRSVAAGVAEQQGGVASRRLLRSAGIEAADVRAEVRSERWSVHGTQTVALHQRPLTDTERWWSAVWEIGHGIALIDGVTSLLACGLRGYQEEAVHLSVVHRHEVSPRPGVRVHKVIRRVTDEQMPSGLPRTRPAVAALRGAHWAVSHRQAATILLMTVQQGLCTPEQLATAARTVRGRTRRAFIRGVVLDISDGVRALGELDFARMCRERGLPEPIRQRIVDTGSGPNRRIYLDVAWECGLVVEIDGIQHRLGLMPIDDLLRQNDVTIDGAMVLRLPSTGLRLHEDVFMAQVTRALYLRGGLGAR